MSKRKIPDSEHIKQARRLMREPTTTGWILIIKEDFPECPLGETPDPKLRTYTSGYRSEQEVARDLMGGAVSLMRKHKKEEELQAAEEAESVPLAGAEDEPQSLNIPEDTLGDDQVWLDFADYGDQCILHAVNKDDVEFDVRINPSPESVGQLLEQLKAPQYAEAMATAMEWGEERAKELIKEAAVEAVRVFFKEEDSPVPRKRPGDAASTGEI